MAAKEFVVYKGDTFICSGSARKCAGIMGVLPETIKYYTTPTYQKRLKKRKTDRGNRISVIKIEDEGE